MHINPRKVLLNAFPIVRHIKLYGADSSLWLQDVIAGVTVGLTLIPQSIAYAALAGLGPQYGLYSSLVGGIMYMIFGTIPEINIAPTALLSLLTFSYVNDSKFGNENAAVLLCFISGVIELLCGLLHLGFLIDFVSTPVVAGFTSAAALTIAFSQLKNLLGLKFVAETMFDVLKNVVAQIGYTQCWDATLSVCCCLFLLGFRQLKQLGSSPQDKKQSSGWRKTIWFLSVSRNALVVIVCAVMAFTFAENNMKPFSLTSEVEAGFPPVRFPLQLNNTYTVTLDVLSELGSGVLVVPLIAILSNVAIAKAFWRPDAPGGQAVNASQEMIAVGLCNVVGSFFGSMPVNASFSRGAVSSASGVRTPINGFYTGVLVILALGFLTPYFSYIPKATLASVIVIAVIFMVEIDICRSVWKINKLDFLPLSITFLACVVLGIEVGILIGIVVNLVIVLYFTARPTVELQSSPFEESRNVIVAKIEASVLLYPAAERIKDSVIRQLSKMPHVRVIVFDCASICSMDYTTIKCLVALQSYFSIKNKRMLVYNLRLNLKEAILRASEEFVIVDSKETLDNFVQTECKFLDENDSTKNAGSQHQDYMNDSYVHNEQSDIDRI